MNLYTDNADLVFHVRHGIPWGSFVPLWEQGFRFEDGPRNLDEARQVYEASLTEVGEFAAREIAPRAGEIDREGVAFRDGQVVQPAALLANVAGLKRLGVLAPSLPREVGGYNFPFSVGAAMLEIIGRACSNTLLSYAFHQGPALLVLRFGTKDQIERWVKPLAAGDLSGAVAMTEPEAGSDVGKMSTTATEEGDRFRVAGRKQFITNGCGDVCIVLARTEAGSKGLDGLSLLIVPRVRKGSDNYRVARPETKHVIRGSATCELHFEGSDAELLGKRGDGFREILTFMNESRAAVAIQGLGLSEAALGAARSYAAERVQMGRPIARHELVADMLLDMEAEVAALRALVYRCTSLHDRVVGHERAGERGEAASLGRELRDRTPLLKWFGSERPLWITRAAVQVHGGYGVVEEYGVERHYRDALILPIYEGTSQIQALMSLKDQVRWLLQRPHRLVTGAVSVEVPADTLGDSVREMAAEYNRTLRHVVGESLGAAGMLRAWRGLAPDARRMGAALAAAERLCAMLAFTRAAEALAAHAGAGAKRRGLAERLVSRALPLLRMHGEIVRSGDRSTLEAVQA